MKKEVLKRNCISGCKRIVRKDVLAAHVRDELGINEINQAKPIQAAFASGLSLQQGDTSSYCNTVSAVKRYGILSIQFCYFLLDHFRSIGC